jgi:hypothetical protein
MVLPARFRLATAMWLLLCAPLVAAQAVPGTSAAPLAPLAADEIEVSTGSWHCSRVTEARAAKAAPQAAAIVTGGEQFALGYVYGVSEAVGKPFPETRANDTRIIALLARHCAEDGARAIRDATLLAGRAMLDDVQAGTDTGAGAATGALACSVYLDARSAGGAKFEQLGRDRIQNWADGYINARFERAGRGLIPTARNKALMLERFSAACTATPSASVREAARSVVQSALPGK